MKKIMILGAGFLQKFVILKAKELGYFTIAVDKNPNSIGFEVADQYGIVDIVDQEACLRYALQNSIDGVITVASDYGVLSVAYVAKELGLPSIKYDVAKVIKNKYLVRKCFHENDVDDISQFYEITNLLMLQELKDCISYPVMVKPCDGSGSKAINRVDDYSDLVNACREGFEVSLSGKVLIEDFVEGIEYGVESFVFNQQVIVMGVMEKLMTSPPHYAELGHAIPSGLMIEHKVKETVKRAIEALGINFGSVNMDLLVTSDDRVCIIDVGARMGGNIIGSHIIPAGSGIDYMECIIKASVSDLAEVSKKEHAVDVVTRLLALDPGIVTEMPDLQEIAKSYGVEIFSNLSVGDVIRPYKNNLDGCGYILAKGLSKAEGINRADSVKSIINRMIKRK